MRPVESADSLEVLVVEDDPAIRRSLVRSLRRAGHNVVHVARCRGARELSKVFQVAVLDLELPDGTGVEIASELLALGVAAKVVFFSGAADPSLLVHAAQLGEVVPKGDKLTLLLKAVSQAGSEPKSRPRSTAVAGEHLTDSSEKVAG